MAEKPIPLRLRGRNGDIWKAHIRGTTQEAIAEKHGISQARVSQVISEVRAAITPETIEDVNRATLDLLQTLTETHMGIVEAGPQPKVSAAGKLVYDPATGEAVPDWSQVMQASTNVVRFTERVAKILGSDAAAKQDVTVTVSPEDIEVVRRIREWKAAQEEG